MDDGGSPYIGLVVFLAMIIANAVCYGYIAALENMNENNMEKLASEGNRRAGWLMKAADGNSSIHKVQFFITGCTMLLGLVTADCYQGLEKAIAFVVLFLILLIAGIFTPSKVAARKPDSSALAFAGIIHGISLIVTPVFFILDAVSNLLSKLLGVDPEQDLDDVTEEEIISMVNEGHEQGVLLASEAEMIHNIFEFGDKEAKDIMTHRKNIVAIDGEKSFRDALSFMIDSNNSRFPVYLEDIDNIIGVLHIKEALKETQDGSIYDCPIKDVKDLVRKVDFIPETRNINTLFKEMQSAKNHMVIVIDEYGQTAGLIAMEDILEEIVGNILDEHDAEEANMILPKGRNQYLVDGMASFEDVAELLELPEQEDEYETLNGFLISKIDKIPADGEEFEVHADGYLFKILEVKDKMIRKVWLEKDSSEQPAESDASCQKDEIMIE